MITFASDVRLGLSGKICSGKSTAARYLVTRYKFVEYAFAAKLKEVVQDVFNTKTKNRALLQLVGEKMREIDANIWARYMVQQLPKKGSVVVSDVRYSNEFASLKLAGFKLIRFEIAPDIQRARIKQLYGELPEALLMHESETVLDDRNDFHYVIDGSLPECLIQSKLDDIVEELSDAEDI